MRIFPIIYTVIPLLFCTACLPSTSVIQQPLENPTDQQLLAIHNAAEVYIRSHISELSTENAVLGGTFYVTDIEWQNNGTALVSYEDGHIALQGIAHVRTNGAEVNVESFSLIHDPSLPPKEEPTPLPEEPIVTPSIIGMANPASVNCQKVGGVLRIEKKPPARSEYGVCYFDDNRQCEEWALFRGECPVGGLKVTGYVTPAARYCAITGGRYVVTGHDGEEQGTCTYKEGNVCDVWDLWEGRC